MEQIETTLAWNKESMINSLLFLTEQVETICFFDIETTGLSANISSLYLIGAAVWEAGHFRLIQWFADDYISEKEILCSFAAFISSCRAVVHYNGSSFDIPYLEKKYAAHNLSSPFDSVKSVDLMRELPKDKTFFHTSNRRLATMEKLLSFNRSDTFTGKDCIRLYTEFMQKKFFRDATAAERKEQLLLHNHDDIQGTILCAQLLSYRHGRVEYSFCEKGETKAGIPCVRMSGILSDGYFPLDIEFEAKHMTGKIAVNYLFQKDRLTIEIPLYTGELYHFFKDYKNYFYLPEEDMAIHKSVGTYVDREYRRQATASTCYIKKSGVFLPIPSAAMDTFPESITLFRETFRSRNYYMELESALSLSQNQLSFLFSAFR